MLAGILAFTDKIIDGKNAKRIRRIPGYDESGPDDTGRDMGEFYERAGRRETGTGEIKERKMILWEYAEKREEEAESGEAEVERKKKKEETKKQKKKQEKKQKKKQEKKQKKKQKKEPADNKK